jgi:hypothetical protein
MKNSTLILLLASASSLSWAEISSLTSEELTDTYIKDTTVIVRQPKQEEPKTKIPVKLKVTPLEEAAQVLPDDPNNQMASISNELSTYDDLNNLRALDNSVESSFPVATAQISIPQTTSQEILDKIAMRYSGYDNPNDLTSLDFNQALIPLELPALDLGPNSDFTATGDSLTISFPNLGNFNNQQIQSPNGEISVNVNPSTIEYTVNLPK